MAPYQQEGERARLVQRLSQEAIALAVQGRWEEAVAINENIIERFPTDIEAYNRLGKALTELGEFARAKEAYIKTLELAPDNAIAKKNLARLASLSESQASLGGEPRQAQARRVAPEHFITEVGKAGVVNLCNLAPSEVLAKVGLGDQVELRVEGQRLIVEREHGEYLGEVELKHGVRLVKLIEGGNKYAAAILNVGEGEVQVVIKETYQHPSQAGHLSFPVKAVEHLRPHAKESLLRRSVIMDEGEVIEEIEHPEEEVEYSKGEGQALPEGFSVVEEIDKKGETEE